MTEQELRDRLAEAEATLKSVCTLKVIVNGEVLNELSRDTMSWRIEMAREYCEKYRLLHE